MSIPSQFTSEGVLPPGTYEASFKEIRQSILVLGDGSSSTWDKDWRNELLGKAEILVNQLWQVGVEDIFWMDRLLKIRIIRMTLMDTLTHI